MKTNSCRLRVGCALVAALSLIVCVQGLCVQSLAEAKHSSALTHLGGVDSIIEQAVADGNIPGAVLVVGHNGAVVYRKAYGEPGAGAAARGDDAGYGV